MHRVRIGLTGLCSVFLLVLLAAAVFGLAPKEQGVREPVDNMAAANASDANPRDPLAELGVTPGGNPEPEAEAKPDAQPPAPVPAPAPKPAG